jgi:polar amino acid transport system substrate-binding protein
MLKTQSPPDQKLTGHAMNVEVGSSLPMQKLRNILCGLLFVLIAGPALSQQDSKVLRSGWYQWDPYQYEVVKGELKHLTGLDVQLLKTIFGKMGYELQLDPVGWRQHQEDLKDGKRDIAGGAFRSKEREAYAYYSIPYRSEKDMLYVRKEDQQKFAFDTVAELVKTLESGSYRLGVIDGYFYGVPLMQYINDPRNAARIIKVKNDRENFSNLLEHKIDAFPIDHLVGATLGWRHGWQKKVVEMPNPVFEDSIHVLFSKQTTNPQLVERFNQTLLQMQSSGEYNKVMRDYLLPVLLGQTAGQPWFFIIDLIGTIAFAISGLLLAREGKYSLFGALVLAALPSIGGGVVRDILINRETLSVLASPVYLVAIFATVMFFYLIFQLEDWYRRKKKIASNQEHMFIGRISNHAAIEFFDALGLSTFAVVGVIVAVEAKIQPLWMWGPLLAALTGAGGGILRDVIRADADNPGLKGSFYAEVALIWGLVLSLFLNWYSFLPKYELIHLTAAVVGVILGGLATRIAVVYFKIRSPMY